MSDEPHCILSDIPVGSRIRVDGPTMTTFYDVRSELKFEKAYPYADEPYLEVVMVEGSGSVMRLYAWECAKVSIWKQ